MSRFPMYDYFADMAAKDTSPCTPSRVVGKLQLLYASATREQKQHLSMLIMLMIEHYSKINSHNYVTIPYSGRQDVEDIVLRVRNVPPPLLKTILVFVTACEEA